MTSSIFSLVRRRLFAVFARAVWPLALLGSVGCGDVMYIGSDLLWTARHETADFSEWTQDSGGGTLFVGGATAAVTQARAHTGQYSVHLSLPAQVGPAESRLFRATGLPSPGYFAAWYLVPNQYAVTVAWTVLSFRQRALVPADPPDIRFDVQLRGLVSKGYVVSVMDHRPEYLRPPMPLPPARVDPGEWFLLEVRLVGGSDNSGRYEVWLNERKIYELADRPTAAGTQLEFAVCSLVENPAEVALELYVDDVAISRSWVSPQSRLERSR